MRLVHALLVGGALVFLPTSSLEAQRLMPSRFSSASAEPPMQSLFRRPRESTCEGRSLVPSILAGAAAGAAIGWLAGSLSQWDPTSSGRTKSVEERRQMNQSILVGGAAGATIGVLMWEACRRRLRGGR